MNSVQNAKKILSKLNGFAVNSYDDEAFELGKVLGTYKSSAKPHVELTFCVDGFAWSYPKSGSILYRNISIAKLPDGKQSDEISVVDSGGIVHTVAIFGKHTKFNDALEILRFIDRVCSTDKSVN